MKIYTPAKLNVSRMNVLNDIFAKQRDSNSRYLDFALMDGSRFIQVDHGDVVINAKRADGTYRSFAGSINSNGTVRVPLTNWMLDAAGALTCSVTVYDGEEKLTSASFTLSVQPAENPTGTVSPDDPNVDLAEQLVAECQAALDEIETKFGEAGFTAAPSYTTIFETEAATTEQHETGYPWVRLSPTTDLINYHYTYRITFDGVEYVVPAERWFSAVNIGKSIGFVGNATLWGDISGFIGEKHEDYPYLITGGVDGSELHSHTEGLYLFTPNTGTHSVKIERIQYVYDELPKELVYGRNHQPIYVLIGSSGYEATSIGVNKMQQLRGTIAVGTNNTLSGQLAKAFGQVNTVSGNAGTAIGRSNTVSGNCSQAVGEENTLSGIYNVALGRANKTSENNSTAFGWNNTASGAYSLAGCAGSEASGAVSVAVGYFVKANHLCQNVFGSYNVPDDSAAAVYERGNYVEIVGNGTGDDARSNARTLDWSGNESLAGSITLGKGTADEVTLTAAQLKQLLALLSRGV